MKKNVRARRRKYNTRKKFVFPLICLSILLAASVVGVFAAVGNPYTDPSTGVIYKITDETTDPADPDKTTGSVTIIGYDKTIWQTNDDDPSNDTTTLRVPDTITFDHDSDPDTDDAVYTVTAIGETETINPKGAFEGNSTLKAIQFDVPGNITLIDQRAFKDCTALRTIGSSADNDSSFSEMTGLTKIGKAAFDGCRNLDTKLDFAISDTTGSTALTTIDTYAFRNCTSLRDVDLRGTSLTSIENTAFSGCYDLRRVRLPGTITNIGSKAFYGCAWLTDFTKLADRTDLTIGEEAFYGCCYLVGPEVIPENLRDTAFGPKMLDTFTLQLRGIDSMDPVYPAAGGGPSGNVAYKALPLQFFKGQTYETGFDPQTGYTLVGLNLLPSTDLPDTYSIDTSIFTKTGTLGEEYSFTIPENWDSNEATLFAVATGAATKDAPTIITDDIPNGIVDKEYAPFTLTAESGTAVKWSAVSSSGVELTDFPVPGLTLDRDTGVISGTPTRTGEYDIIIRATNTYSFHDKEYNMTVNTDEMAKPDNLDWNDRSYTDKVVATWDLLEYPDEAITYLVQLYKDGTAIGGPKEITRANVLPYCDFTEELSQNGAGIYTFTVTATHDGYNDSVSDMSPEYEYGITRHKVTATAVNGTVELSQNSLDNIEGIRVSELSNGLEVSVRDGSVDGNTPLTFNFAPSNDGYQLEAMTRDGVDTEKRTTYSITDIENDTSLKAVFDTYSNSIGGINPGASYVQGEIAEFTAYGDSMENSDRASDGDLRWEPVSWWLDDGAANDFTDGTYTETIDTKEMTRTEHTLYVSFQQQEYNEAADEWYDTEEPLDRASVSFKVTDVNGNTDPEPDAGGDGGDKNDATTGGTSGGGSSGGTSGGGSSGGGGTSSIIDAVRTSDTFKLGLWSALAVLSLGGIGFCIRRMLKFA